MFFDTHCHLNFKTFDKQENKVIERAKKAGVLDIIIPGTDIDSSIKALKIAERFDGIYAAIGIHPHHVMQYQISNIKDQIYILKIKNDLKEIEKLLMNKKTVAVGEVGIDRHIYKKTKYQDYKIEEEFIKLQKIVLKKQIKLAIKYNKSLILHNREAKKDMLEVLNEVWDEKLEGRTVFHCCEPDKELLKYAQEHKMYIGVDGDLIYWKEKQEFIKTVPLEMLVLETDSPFLSPTKQFPNEPKNIISVAELIAKLKNISNEKIAETTTKNAEKLFIIPTETRS